MSQESMAAVRQRLSLQLRPIPLPEVRSLVAGEANPDLQHRWHPEYPTPDTLSALCLIVASYQVMERPLDSGSPWWIYQMIMNGCAVGDIGFHGPPADEGPQVVEIGYGVVPAWRGRGLATAACRMITEQAWASGADQVVAEVRPTNVASRKVLLRNGFHEDGEDRFLIEAPAR
jgi:RimJ/RimL family protein N-acetyltransferase